LAEGKEMSSFDAVEYLVLRMFPAKLVHQACLDIGKGKPCEKAEAYIEKVRNYVTTLRALSDESLMAMVEDERQRDAALGETAINSLNGDGSTGSTKSKCDKKVGDNAAAEPVTIIHFSRYEDRLRAMRERGKAT